MLQNIRCYLLKRPEQIPNDLHQMLLPYYHEKRQRDTELCHRRWLADKLKLHSRKFLSQDVPAKMRPSGEAATPRTTPVWLSMTVIREPELGCHMHILLLSPPDIGRNPSAAPGSEQSAHHRHACADLAVVPQWRGPRWPHTHSFR